MLKPKLKPSKSMLQMLHYPLTIHPTNGTTHWGKPHEKLSDLYKHVKRYSSDKILMVFINEIKNSESTEKELILVENFGRLSKDDLDRMIEIKESQGH